MIKLLQTNKKLWDIYTSSEEYNPSVLDKHQRFSSNNSENKEIGTPVVSDFLIKNGYKATYPENKKFALCLTHDIDGFNAFPKVKMAKEGLVALGQLDFKSFGQKLLLGLGLHRIGTRTWKKSINPLYNFESVMALEAKYGAKSSFYFLSLDKNNQDFDYKTEEISDLLKVIVKNGWEVGLHGSREASSNLSVLKSEKNKLEQVLGQKIVGYRNHYLMFKTPQTWENLQEAGFSYDTTFGYADAVGFRSGLCHPFKPYNLLENKLIDLVEIPLVEMDRTLEHLGYDSEKILTLTKEMIDNVCDRGGVMTILWHNTELVGEKIKIYEEILKYAQSKQAWITSAKEVYDWYTREDSKMEWWSK